jgi:hypothetical protein
MRKPALQGGLTFGEAEKIVRLVNTLFLEIGPKVKRENLLFTAGRCVPRFRLFVVIYPIDKRRILPAIDAINHQDTS